MGGGAESFTDGGAHSCVSSFLCSGGAPWTPRSQPWKVQGRTSKTDASPNCHILAVYLPLNWFNSPSPANAFASARVESDGRD